MDTADFLRHLQSLLWYEDQLVHLEQVPSRTPRFDDLDPPLDPKLRAKLDSIGVSGLYSHQVAAIPGPQRRQERHRRHASRQRQEHVLQPPRS